MSRTNPANARFDHGADVAQSSAKVQLEFIMANLKHLAAPKDRARWQAAESFSKIVARGDTLTPNQLSYVDGIYETVMQRAGFGGVSVQVDKKKKGLKFG